MEVPENPEKPEKEKPKKRADAAETARRVEEILRIRLDCAQFHDVVAYAAEKGWGVNDRQIRTLMQRADELIVSRQDKSRKKVIARHLAQRLALAARAINAGDYRTALAILDSEAKLRGLFPDTKEVKDLVKLAQSLGMKVEELERRLANAARSAESETATGEPKTGTPGPDHPWSAGGPTGSVPG